MSRSMRPPAVGVVLVVAALVLGCAGEPRRPSEEAGDRAATSAGADPVRFLDLPAGAGSFAPALMASRGGLVASWLETVDEVETTGEPGHRLLVSTLDDSGWSEPAVVAEGSDFFANWADFPAVVEAGDGSLLAHWLAKTGEETYAYSIFLARSVDGGASWTPAGRLNDDDTETEHGFVSWLAEEDGARAFWLDGRAMAEGGAMSLRTAHLAAGDGPGGLVFGPSEVLDDRVCECCNTGAARLASGPLVVYRDRSPDEVRDIWIVRADDGWTAPAAVAEDGWKIPGCPVNGPRVAAAGDHVAAAWFTLAGGVPRVRMALSSDGGESFAAPLELDEEDPFGRVDVLLDERRTAWVSWLAREGERAAVVLGRVTADGRRAEALRVAETDGGRHSGFPRLARIGERIFVAWVDIEGDTPSRVRIAEVPAAIG